MKLAIVTPYLNNIGGREKVATTIINSILSKAPDLEIHIFGGQIDSKIYQVLKPKIKLHHIPMIKGHPFLETISFFVSSYITLKHTQFDCYHFHWFCLPAPGPSLYTVHSVHRRAIWEIERRRGLLGKMRYLIRRYYPIPVVLEKVTFFLGHKHFVAVSSKIADEIQKTYKVPENAITIIPNPMGLEKIELGKKQTWRNDVREMLDIDSANVIVGTVANRLSGKNIDIILEALALMRHEKIGFLLVGTLKPPAEKKLYRWARQLGLSDRLYYMQGQENIWKLYAAMDVFLFPSSYESYGLAFLEALYMGIPSIVSIHVGGLEFIPQRFLNKFVFRLEQLDSVTLRDLLQKIIEHSLYHGPEEIRDAQQFLEELNESAVESYLKCYRNLVISQR